MFKKSNYSSQRFSPLKILFFIVVFIVFVAALSWVVMYLWNNILVDVTGVKPLNFWKSAGLLILAKILIGGIRRHKNPLKHSPTNHWRKKWMQMNEEERKEAKSRWKEHCRRRNIKEEEE